MKNLQHGDPCRVRMLSTGEVVDAIYEGKAEVSGTVMQKAHFVYVGGHCMIAIPHTLRSAAYHSWECRFVGPTGVRS